MRNCSVVTKALLLVLLFLPGLCSAAVNHYYVSATGSDSNSGTSAGSPWKTLAHAESALTLGSGGTATATNGWYSRANVGAVVHVLAGNYTFSSSTCLADSMPFALCGTRNGTSSARILFLSDTYHGAVLNGKFVTRGDYVSIVGFTITCPSCDAGIWIGFGSNTVGSSNLGFNDEALLNNIHDTAQTYNGGNKVFYGCPTSGAIYTVYAASGILIDSNQIDHFAATARDSGGQACHEAHGIYVSGPRNTITNNIITRAAGFGIHLFHNTCQEVVSNNLVANNYAGGIDVSSGSANDGSGDPLYCANVDQYSAINNNLAVNNGADWGFFGIREYSTRNAHNTFNHNLLIGNNPGNGIYQRDDPVNNPLPASDSFSGNLCGGGGQSCASSTAATTASLFKSYSGTASGDYHLKSTAEAVDTGTNANCASSPGQSPCEPATDFDGRSRPQGSTYDIGPLEYASGSSPPPNTAPHVQLSSSTLAFGNVPIGSSATLTETIVNNGTAALVIGTITKTGTSEFSFGTDSCSGQTIAVNASCAWQATLTPTSTGSKTGSVSIPSNTTTATVSLTGTGTSVSTSYSTSAIDDFPDSGGTTGCTSGTSPQWCWEHDPATAGTCTATSALVASPSTDGQSRRFIPSWTALGGCRFHVYLGTSHLDTASNSFVYHTKFYFTDYTHVNSIEFDHNQVLSNGNTVIYGTQMNFVAGFWQYTTNLSGSAHWNTSTIAASKPTANAWHEVFIRSHRDANGIVTYDSITLDGSTTAFVGASGNSAFSLGNTPLGAQFENFQVDGDNSSNNTTAYLDEFSITGSTVGSSGSATATNSIIFPATLVGTTSAAQTITITNTSGSSITVSSKAVSGPFAVSDVDCGAFPFTLTASASCHQSATFSPTAAGTVSGSVAYTTSANTVTVAFSGTGTSSIASLSPSGTVDFGNVTVGSSSVRTFSEINSGSSALTSISVSLATPGSQCSDYAQSNTCGSSIPAHTSCNITVTATAGSTGTRACTLKVTSDDASSPNTTALTMNGVTAPTTGGGSGQPLYSMNVKWWDGTLLNGTIALHSIPILSDASAGGVATWRQINGGADCGDASHAVKYTASTDLFGCQTISGGTVTSVGLSVNSGSSSGIFAITASPVTTSGTLNFNLSGTSGGVPYFSSSSILSSSGALTANLPVFGGGAGTAPFVGTRTGNTTQVATWTGATTAARCVDTDASGNLQITAADCGSSSGTVTTTGSPASGNLTKFSGTTSITNGDLSGDATTSGTLVTTVAKVNGVSYAASPSTHQVPVITASNTETYKTVPDCTDTAGNHLNYTQSSDAFSCGTSVPTITVIKRWTIEYAGCNAGTAYPAWNLPASNAMGVACTTDDQEGNLTAADGQIAYYDLILPDDFSSFNKATINFTTTDTTNGHTVIWNLATYCVQPNNNVANPNAPTYNTAASVTTTLGGSAVSGGVYQATISSLTTTGCSAGYKMRLKLSRATDTDTDTAVQLTDGLMFAYNGSQN